MGPMLLGTFALFCVWLGNGLWHGAGTQYIRFGMYYFVIISLGRIVEPLAQSVTGRLNVSRDSRAYRAMRLRRTQCIVFVGELIFRSSDIHVALDMLWAMVTRLSFGGLGEESVLLQALDTHDWYAVFIGTGCVLAIDFAKEAGFSPWESISKRGASLRWSVWLALLAAAVVVFGAYGMGYAPVDPMYAQY